MQPLQIQPPIDPDSLGSLIQKSEPIGGYRGLSGPKPNFPPRSSRPRTKRRGRSRLALLELERRLRARMDVKLFVDVLQVPFHSGHRDAQTVSDGFVPQSLHDQFQHFTLTIG